jgi:hypothetical protein
MLPVKRSYHTTKLLGAEVTRPKALPRMEAFGDFYQIRIDVRHCSRKEEAIHKLNNRKLPNITYERSGTN